MRYSTRNTNDPYLAPYTRLPKFDIAALELLGLQTYVYFSEIPDARQRDDTGKLIAGIRNYRRLVKLELCYVDDETFCITPLGREVYQYYEARAESGR